MVEISKRDWKLFREKLAGWQESYMERLYKEDEVIGLEDLSDFSEDVQERVKFMVQRW